MWPVKVTSSFGSPCLDDRSLVRMRDEEGSLLWAVADAGIQLALRLIKAISPTQFEFFTLSSPPSGRTGLECSLWAGSTRLHLQNHFPDDISSFPLGSQPRVAAAEMGEVAGTAEIFCEQLISYVVNNPPLWRGIHPYLPSSWSGLAICQLLLGFFVQK